MLSVGWLGFASDALGAVVYDDGKGEVFIGRSMAQTKPYSETIAASIDQEVKALIDKAWTPNSGAGVSSSPLPSRRALSGSPTFSPFYP